MRYALLGLVLVIGCAHHAPPPPRSMYLELEARTNRILEAMDRLVASLEAANDCRQMAYALRQFTRHAEEIGELGKLRLRLSPVERERFDDEHEDDARMLDRVRAAAQPCMRDRETHVAYETAGFWH